MGKQDTSLQLTTEKLPARSTGRGTCSWVLRSFPPEGGNIEQEVKSPGAHQSSHWAEEPHDLVLWLRFCTCRMEELNKAICKVFPNSDTLLSILCCMGGSGGQSGG